MAQAMQVIQYKEIQANIRTKVENQRKSRAISRQPHSALLTIISLRRGKLLVIEAKIKVTVNQVMVLLVVSNKTMAVNSAALNKVYLQP